MRHIFIRGLMLAAMCAAIPVAGAAPHCTPALAKSAETSLDTIGSWQDLHLAYQHYAACDDGSIAEGYSDAVVLLLTDDWPKVTHLAGLFRQDPGFRGFVLRHLDMLMSRSQYVRLQQLSAKQCPAGAAGVCGDIHQALTRLKGHIRQEAKPEDLEPPRP